MIGENGERDKAKDLFNDCQYCSAGRRVGRVYNRSVDRVVGLDDKT